MYFDFCKAFNSVSHVKLSQKLSAYGLNGPLFSFLADFLSGRYQKVVLRYSSSSFIPVTSGVPQGSVFGPILFLIYINDISDKFCGNITIKLFADDIKRYNNKMELTLNLLMVIGSCIDSIAHWSSTWQLKLADSKCHHMRVGLISFKPVQYVINNSLLHSIASSTDLGVKMSSNLSFSEYINSIVVKAKFRSNNIIRCFLSKDCNLLTQAFITYVRPLLEYCSPVGHQVM